MRLFYWRMKPMYDIAIIGGGITGCFLARQLCRYALKTVLIEKNTDVADETTKANSGIIHSGYDACPGTLKAKLNRLGNPMFDAICRDLGVPFQRIGSLTLALSEEEIPVLQQLYERGQANEIGGLSLLSAEAVRKTEPRIHSRVKAALLAKTAGIVDPFGLAIALAENAADNGTDIRLNSRVVGIRRENDGYVLTTPSGWIKARYVVNCGGVFAGEINELLSPARFRIRPVKGEYIVFDKQVGDLVRHVVFQCPSEKGKGVLVTPTVHGNLMVGPNSQDVEDKEDVSTTRSGLDEILATAGNSVETIPLPLAITGFSGLRASADTGDFVIEELSGYRGFINAAGIDSPGLTASPAIAELVIDLLKSGGLKLTPNPAFDPIRKPIVNVVNLSEEEKSELIRKDPRYGRIICRCESITEGEIVEAIRRRVGARSVDGVKRRVRAGMGRCQGGFCGPRVLEILARELHVSRCQVVKDRGASYLLSEQ